MYIYMSIMHIYTDIIKKNSYEVLHSIIHLSCYVDWSFAYVCIYILYMLIHMNYDSYCVGLYPYYIYNTIFRSKLIRKYL